ncbi:MAG: hypothetical protein JJU28_01655 [Cyclobacteriaceae bacterium]|nr:hypothetical protein [Cyclobacteriaceae bacterium]
MKDLSIQKLLTLLCMAGMVLVFACNNDDEPQPDPPCTFESDADCFCDENPEDAQCIERELERVCNEFDRTVMFINWRNSSDAGIFTWDEMEPVEGQPGIFTISQPAVNWYTVDGEVPNFGAQLLEFSNQPGYGGLNNGQPWQLYRNQRNSDDPSKDWNFPSLVDGKTSKTAYYVSVSTRNASGEETVLCPRPADVTNPGGFRLNLFSQSGSSIVTRNSILTYTIDANTGEVALEIEELDPCTNFDKSVCFIRWRNSSNAGDFSWAEMEAVEDQEGIFRISQPAANWVDEATGEYGFGAQILEFSNQPNYGGNLDGLPWALYRNQTDDWTFPNFTAGVTSKTAHYIKVSTRNSQGVETVLCDKPSDVTTERGFRFWLNGNEGFPDIPKTAVFTYTIDMNTGEVAASFE